tara:strand:+ start:3204 stop:4088 length:885 start_codon:yes stop_codon:yes gene_type:complete
MVHVVTLVTPAEDSALEPLVLETARWLDVSVSWLQADRAADIIVPSRLLDRVESVLADVVGDHAVDRAVQPIHGRRKKLLVGDMDSTFITVECIDVLAARAGLGDKVAAITARSIRGELNFSDSLRERVGLIKGVPESLLQDTWDHDIATTPGAKTLIATMRQHGAITALVSGGFTWFTQRVTAQVGFDIHHANTLLTENGVLTGKVAEPILDRDAKRTFLNQIAREYGLSPSETITVGDGSNDCAMLSHAGTGVAYHGVPAAVAAADMAVDHGDLTTLLFFQGYSKAEFARPD